MDCLAVTGALGIFTQPEAEVEAQLDQVGNYTGFGVEGDGRSVHDGVDNAEGDGLFLFDQRVLNAVGFKTGEAYVQSDVSLGVWSLSEVGEAIQEVGHCNHPSRLRNRLFPSQSSRCLE